MAQLIKDSATRRMIMKAVAGAVSVPFTRGIKGGSSDTGVSVTETEETVTLSNSLVAVTIRKDNGGIKQIRSREFGRRLRDPTSDISATTWKLTFDQYKSRKLAISNRAGRPDITTEESDSNATISLTWSNPELNGGDRDDFDGDVTVNLHLREQERFAHWDLSVTNRSDLAITQAVCPSITSIEPPVEDGSDAIIFPTAMGRRIEDPTSIDPDSRSAPHGIYPMEFMNMQFTSYTGGGSQFYLQAEDPRGNQKSVKWSWDPGGDRLQLWHTHFEPVQPGADVTVPYTVATGWLAGNWYDAADHYREWVDDNGWLPDDSPNLPDWTTKLGAAQQVWSYKLQSKRDLPQTYKETMETALSWKQGLGLQHHHVHWNHWTDPKTAAHVPKESPAAFRSALETAEQHNMTVAVQDWVKGIQTPTPFWESNKDQVLEWASRRKDGEPRTRTVPAERLPISYSITTYLIDFTVGEWQIQLREWYTRLVSNGVREKMLDGFPAYWHPCFSERHNHPPGRGAWSSRQSRSQLQKMQAQLRDEREDTVLSGEGIADFYLPQMQVQYTKDAVNEGFYRPGTSQHATGDIIPIFSYTFGDKIVTRAHGIWSGGPITDPERKFQRLAIGRTVAWGAIPQFLAPAEAYSSRGPNDWKARYIGRVARARETYANRFVAKGEMLRKQVYDAPEFATTDTVTTRKGRMEFEFSGSAIKGSAWRSSRGEIGLLFTNVAPDGESHQADVILLEQPFALPDRPWIVYAVKHGEYKLVASAGEEPGPITLHFDPIDIGLLVITPASEKRSAALQGILDAQKAVPQDNGRATTNLREAKRAFEADDLLTAQNKAQKAMDVARTPTKTPSGTPTETPTPWVITPMDETETPTTSDGPGFTTVTGLLGGIIAVITRWMARNEDSDGRD